MRQGALLFKTAQNCADGGVLERAVQLRAPLFCGEEAEPPNDGQDASFEFAKFGWVVMGWSVTRHSVTDCIIRNARARKNIFRRNFLCLQEGHPQGCFQTNKIGSAHV